MESWKILSIALPVLGSIGNALPTPKRGFLPSSVKWKGNAGRSVRNVTPKPGLSKTKREQRVGGASNTGTTTATGSRFSFVKASEKVLLSLPPSTGLTPGEGFFVVHRKSAGVYRFSAIRLVLFHGIIFVRFPNQDCPIRPGCDHFSIGTELSRQRPAASRRNPIERKHRFNVPNARTSTVPATDR